jgi:hypothetical protein
MPVLLLKFCGVSTGEIGLDLAQHFSVAVDLEREVLHVDMGNYHTCREGAPRVTWSEFATELVNDRIIHVNRFASEILEC